MLNKPSCLTEIGVHVVCEAAPGPQQNGAFVEQVQTFVCSKQYQRLGVLTQVSNDAGLHPSNLESVGRSVQGGPWLHGGFVVSLGYTRPEVGEKTSLGSICETLSSVLRIAKANEQQNRVNRVRGTAQG